MMIFDTNESKYVRVYQSSAADPALWLDIQPADGTALGETCSFILLSADAADRLAEELHRVAAEVR